MNKTKTINTGKVFSGCAVPCPPDAIALLTPDDFIKRKYDTYCYRFVKATDSVAIGEWEGDKFTVPLAELQVCHLYNSDKLKPESQTSAYQAAYQVLKKNRLATTLAEIEWKVGDRAFYKGQKCQIDKLGTTGAYRNKAKVTLAPDFEERWIPLSELELFQPTTNNQQPTTKQCPSSSTNFLAALADSVKLQELQGVSLSETTLISTPTLSPSTGTITQGPTSTAILEPIIPTSEPMFTQSDSLAREPQVLELAPDLITLNLVFGLKPCDALSKGVQTMWLLKTLKGLSTEDYEKFLGDSEWQAIRGTIRNSYRQLGSALLTAGTDFSLLDTPTSYAEGSDTHRPAGQNKLERVLKRLPTPIAKDAESTPGKKFQEYSLNREISTYIKEEGNRLQPSRLPTPLARDGKGPTGTPNESLTEPIQKSLMGADKMHPAVPGWMMGFLLGYAESVLMAGGKPTQPQTIQASPPELQVAEPVSNFTAEQLCPNKPRSRFAESSTSIHSSKPATEPFLKWAGGKTWAVGLAKELYAPFKNYRLVSLTLGGGAIELGLQPERALLCDVNPYLINLWQWVQQGKDFTISLESREEYFLETRDRFNKDPLHPEAPQWFYLLNHTCFNGLQRGSSVKHFNVGWGKYKAFHGQLNLTHYVSAMQTWEFKAQSWEQTLLELKNDDFVIFDPPYHGKGFKEYYGRFTDDDQVSAANELAKLLNPVVAFNAATPEMLELYKSLGFKVEVREVPRSISCTGDRTPALEMMATKNMTRSVTEVIGTIKQPVETESLTNDCQILDSAESWLKSQIDKFKGDRKKAKALKQWEKQVSNLQSLRVVIEGGQPLLGLWVRKEVPEFNCVGKIIELSEQSTWVRWWGSPTPYPEQLGDLIWDEFAQSTTLKPDGKIRIRAGQKALNPGTLFQVQDLHYGGWILTTDDHLISSEYWEVVANEARPEPTDPGGLEISQPAEDISGLEGTGSSQDLLSQDLLRDSDLSGKGEVQLQNENLQPNRSCDSASHSLLSTAVKRDLSLTYRQLLQTGIPPAQARYLASQRV